MFNLKFIEQLIKLCHSLPMWSGLCISVFGGGHRTASSARSESYFKCVKQLLKGKTPCSVDVFVKEHIDVTEGVVILASGSTENPQKTAPAFALAEGSSIGPTEIIAPNPESAAGSLGIECLACKAGNAPTGAHQCIYCNCNVHILPGCSHSIPGESQEGYGEKRICMQCFTKQKKDRDVQEMYSF